LQPFAVVSDGFHKTAQKLTGNTENEQILNIAIINLSQFNPNDVDDYHTAF